MRRAAISSVCVLALCLLAAGCGQGDSEHELTDVRKIDTPPQLVPPGTSAAERFGFRDTRKGGMGSGDPHAGVPGMGATAGNRRQMFAWKTPEGWEEVSGHRMRAATWRVRGEPQTDCALTVLQGSGGDMLSNVNRWRDQMGAPKIDEDALAKLPRKPLLGKDAVYVNVLGRYAGMSGGSTNPDPNDREVITEARLLGLLLELPGVAVFLKFTGPAKVVEANQGAFEDLAASLQISAHGAPSHHGGAAGTAPKPPATSGAAGQRKPLQWTVPEGWEVRPDRQMRLVTIAPPGADASTECYLSVLGGDGGGLTANINRWQNQMGQKALSDEAIAKLETVDVFDAKGVLVKIHGSAFRGQGGKAIDDATMYGMVCQKDGFVIFAKMYGPTDVMKQHWDAFVAFCKSIRQ